MPKEHAEQETYTRNKGFEYRAWFSGGYILYEGWAYPTGNTGSATDEGALVWQILKHTHDGDGNLTKSSWANHDDSFIFSWTLRATYTYA